MTKTARKSGNAGKEKAGTAGASDLLTAGKLAVAWGVKPGDVKQAIALAGVQPDATRCGCAYYGKAAAASIKRHLTKA